MHFDKSKYACYDLNSKMVFLPTCGKKIFFPVNKTFFNWDLKTFADSIALQRTLDMVF